MGYNLVLANEWCYTLIVSSNNMKIFLIWLGQKFSYLLWILKIILNYLSSSSYTVDNSSAGSCWYWKHRKTWLSNCSTSTIYQLLEQRWKKLYNSNQVGRIALYNNEIPINLEQRYDTCIITILHIALLISEENTRWRKKKVDLNSTIN